MTTLSLSNDVQWTNTGTHLTDIVAIFDTTFSIGTVFWDNGKPLARENANGKNIKSEEDAKVVLCGFAAVGVQPLIIVVTLTFKLPLVNTLLDATYRSYDEVPDSFWRSQLTDLENTLTGQGITVIDGILRGY